MGHEQIVQPLGLSSLFEHDVDARAEPLDQRHDRASLGRHRGPHTHRSGLVAYGGDDRCLVDVEREILNRLMFHGSRSFFALGFWRFQSYRKGRAFNMRWAVGRAVFQSGRLLGGNHMTSLAATSLSFAKCTWCMMRLRNSFGSRSLETSTTHGRFSAS